MAEPQTHEMQIVKVQGRFYGQLLFCINGTGWITNVSLTILFQIVVSYTSNSKNVGKNL